MIVSDDPNKKQSPRTVTPYLRAILFYKPQLKIAESFSKFIFFVRKCRGWSEEQTIKIFSVSETWRGQIF